MLRHRAPEGPGIGVAQQVFPVKIRCSGLLQRRAGVKYGNPVRHAQRGPQVMRDQKHTVSLICIIPEIRKHLPGQRLLHPRRRLIRDNQLRMTHQGSQQQHPSGHTAGKFKRILFLHIPRQAILPHQVSHFSDTGVILPAICNLPAGFHQRVQRAGPLRYQGNLPSPQLPDPFAPHLFPQVIYVSSHLCICRKQIENGMRQKAFAGTAAPDNCHNLPRMHTDVQI